VGRTIDDLDDDRGDVTGPPPRPAARAGRLGVLAGRDFRIFYAGYVTSLVGSAMSQVALTFAVLGSGGTPADLGFIFAASVLPLVAFMLGGGVVADRIGRRPVMLAADATSLAVQATLAAALFAGRPPIWLFVVLAALLGASEAFFIPALGGLVPAVAPGGRLADANALVGVARAAASVAGPALAGILIAVTRPAAAIAVDAATFGVSLVTLALIRVPPVRHGGQPAWRDLADGLAQLTGQRWLAIITVQFALFNLLTWAPYLLLGPIMARDYLGGASAWGTVLGTGALGSVLAGLTLIGRRPQRPLLVAVAGTLGYPVPCLLLCLHAPEFAVAAGAALAGAGSAVFNTCFQTVLQERVPAGLLSRTTALVSTGAYALGAAGYAVIGPVAGIVGPAPMLGFGAAYATASSLVVLALPAIRSVRRAPA